MKKLILIVLILLPAVSFAQSGKQKVKELFARCLYDDAAALCYGQASMVSQEEQAFYYKFAKKCNTCKELHKMGDNAMAREDYQAAVDAYTRLISLNPSDSTASSNLAEAKREYEIVNSIRLEEELWTKLMSEGNIDLYREYIATYPNGKYVTQVNELIRDEELWANTQHIGTVPAYQNYINQAPSGAHIEEAKMRYAAGLDDFKWKETEEIGTLEAYEDYISQVPFGAYIEEARARCASILDDSFWKETEEVGTLEAYKDYYDYADEYFKYKKLAYIKYSYLNSIKKHRYNDALNYLTEISEVAKLNSEEAKAVALCREMLDYEKLISSEASFQAYRRFLEKWPNGVKTNDVKNMLARLYADNKMFSLAKQYATDDDTRLYIKGCKSLSIGERVSQTSSLSSKKPSPTASGSYTSSSSKKRSKSLGHYWALGGFWEGASEGVLNLGLELDYYVGTFENIANFGFGLQYKYIQGNNDSKETFNFDSGSSFYGDYHPYLTAHQLSVPLTLRFNIGKKLAIIKFILDLGCSAGLNFSPSISYREEVSSTVPTISLNGSLLKSSYNLSPFVRAGFGGKSFSVMWYVRYDTTPIFNADAVKTDAVIDDTYYFNLYENYSVIRNQVDERFFYGAVVRFNF